METPNLKLFMIYKHGYGKINRKLIALTDNTMIALDKYGVSAQRISLMRSMLLEIASQKQATSNYLLEVDWKQRPGIL